MPTTRTRTRTTEDTDWRRCSSCRRRFSLGGRGRVPEEAEAEADIKAVAILPRILDCGHHVCEPCIRRMAGDNLFSCPVEGCLTRSRPDVDTTPRLPQDPALRFPLNETIVGKLALEMLPSDKRPESDWEEETPVLDGTQISGEAGIGDEVYFRDSLQKVRQALEKESSDAEAEIERSFMLLATKLQQSKDALLKRKGEIITREEQKLKEFEELAGYQPCGGDCRCLVPETPRNVLSLDAHRADLWLPRLIQVGQNPDFRGYQLREQARARSSGFRENRKSIGRSSESESSRSSRSSCRLPKIPEEPSDLSEPAEIMDSIIHQADTRPVPEPRQVASGERLGAEHDFQVVRVKSPSEVYVTLTRRKDAAREIERSLAAINLADVANAAIGDRAVCHFGGRRHRATVREVCHGGEEVAVYFDDTGEERRVHRMQLKVLPVSPGPITWPPLALRCRLPILPVGSVTGWTPEATHVLEHLVSRNRKGLRLEVLQVKDGVCTIELLIEKASPTREAPTTASRVLTFRELARPITPQTSEKVEETVRFLFVHDYNVTVGDTLSGKVAPHGNGVHLEDDDIFISFVLSDEKLEKRRELNKLTEKMGEMYSRLPVHLFSVECPRRGQCVAVDLSARGCDLFCRAIVEELHPATNSVTVVLVDDGDSIQTEIKNLRLLVPEFMDLIPLAVKVRLFGVAIHGDALDQITQYLSGRLLGAFVEVNDHHDYVVASLYESRDTKDVCISAFILASGWVTPTKGYDFLSTWSIEYPKAGDLYEVIKSRGEDAVLEFAQVLTSVSVEEMKPCKVSWVISPDKIYAADEDGGPSFSQKLSKMHQKLEAASVKPAASIKIHGIYAIKHFEKWKRARVVEELEPSTFNVWLIDEEKDAVLPAEDISSLDMESQQLRPSGKVCRLAGVKLPKGEEQWSNRARSLLKSVLNLDAIHYYLYKEDEEEKENGIRRVSICGRKNIARGAMAPSETVVFDVAQLLIEAKVAIPEEEEEVGLHGFETNRFSWLPPELPSMEKELPGKITFVDSDLYVQFDWDQDAIKRVREELNARFATSPRRPQDRNFTVDDACIARFQWDQNWHRGIVEAVGDDDTYSVKYIDYGGQPPTSGADMRKDVMCKETPTLCTQVKMSLVPADGVTMLDIHLKLIDREVTITLSEQPVRGQPIVGEVFLQRGIRIREYLLLEGLIKS